MNVDYPGGICTWIKIMNLNYTKLCCTDDNECGTCIVDKSG